MKSRDAQPPSEAMPLPTVVLTAVVRSAHQGDSHGGVYLLDLERGSWRQTIDWNDGSIDWEGRGGDRGLRGIAVHGEEIFIAASNEVFVYDRDFRQKRSFTNRYLALCHEITVADGRLYLTSTAFDSVLVYDIAAQRFVAGYCVKVGQLPDPQTGKPVRRTGFGAFDPEVPNGPPRQDTAHINNIHVDGGRIYLCGVNLDQLLVIEEGRLAPYARVPFWTHNARPFRGGVLANCTGSDALIFMDRAGVPKASLPVPRYDPAALLNADMPKDHARQAFARGLCVLDQDTLAVGSSPATVTVFRLDPPRQVKSINLTLDIRNAVHGLALWPF